jgi:hypothetical protein
MTGDNCVWKTCKFASKDIKMITFTTISGSVYELNLSERKIRRLGNAMDLATTTRQGKDEEWQKYDSLLPSRPEVGEALIIFWDAKTTPLLEGSDPGAVPATITSYVSSILPDDANPSESN